MLIQLLIINLILFGVLVFVLRLLFTRQVNVALNRLKALYEENLRREAQLSEELRRAQEEKAAEIRRGKEEADALIEEARKEALKMRLSLEEEAKRNAQKIIAQAKEDTEKLKEKLNEEIKAQSLDLALNLIKETFTERDKEDLQHQFINEIIEELAKLSTDKFTVPADKVKVISSYPLEDGQRQSLKKVLKEKLGFLPSLEEVINRELISGLMLEMGGLVIDGSLRTRLDKAVLYSEKSS